MDVAHLLYSGAAAAGAAAFVAAAPAALDARWAPPAHSDAAAAADLLACVAAGFYGFQLWVLVRYRRAFPKKGGYLLPTPYPYPRVCLKPRKP